jgi:hypothetical protein
VSYLALYLHFGPFREYLLERLHRAILAAEAAPVRAPSLALA